MFANTHNNTLINIIFKIFIVSIIIGNNVQVSARDRSQAIDNKKYKVEVIDNMLYFKSRVDYENTIDYLAQLGDENFANWEKEILFNSLRAKFNEETLEKMGIEDNLLATLLNPKSSIRIGDNIFNLDMKNETVKMTPALTFSNKNDSNTKNGYRKFSTEDDVLNILDGVETEDTQKRRRRYCKTSKKGPYYWSVPDGVKIKYKVVYQKSGIFKSLQAKIKREGAQKGIHLQLKTVGHNFWRNKRHSRTISGLKGGEGRKYNIRPYNRTRRLKDFRYSLEFRAVRSDGGWGRSRVLTISCRR